MAGDIHYPELGLLVPFTGANNSAIFTDTSITPKTLSGVSGAKISTSVADPFGASNGVLVLNGSSDYVTIPYASYLDFGTASDFTIEGFCYSASVGGVQMLYCRQDVDLSKIALQIRTNGTSIEAVLRGIGSSVYTITGSTVMAINTWYHFALVRVSGVFKLFLAGIQQGSSLTQTLNLSGTVGALIGSIYSAGNFYNGRIAQFRYHPGFARYTANFTPPAAPFLNYAGQFSGNITESLAISDWLITASRCRDGAFAGSSVSSGSSFLVNCNTLEPCNITLSAKIDYAFTASKVATVGDLMVPSNPDVTPHLFKVTAVTGDAKFGATEPSYNLSGTTTSGNVTLTYIGPVVDPVSLGFKIAA